MKQTAFAFAVLLLTCFCKLNAQTMTQQVFTVNNSTVNYWLYTPENQAENLPLLVYLHGGSGKGNDLNALLALEGFPKYLNDGELGKLNAYVIIPQLSKNVMGWSNIAATLRELIVKTLSSYKCDNTRVSITGHSMGGTGAWDIAARFPNLFYRIAPLSGSIKNTAENIEALKSSTIWAIVGSDDDIVDPQISIDFVDALNSTSAQITVIDGAGHFDIPQAYLSDEYRLVDWLLGTKEDSGATAIQDVANGEKAEDENYYDLSGRIVPKPAKGVYVHKRRVVIIR